MLVSGIAAALAAAFSMGSPAAAEDTIKLGVIYAMTG